MHPYFNLTSKEFVENPYPFYRELRDKGPLYRSPFGFVAVMRDGDVRTLLNDRRIGRAFYATRPGGASNPLGQRPGVRSTSGWMLLLNPPDHTRLRGLMSKAFTAKRIMEMRPRIQQTVDHCLDRIAEGDRAELMADFARRIPATVIFDLLGIPAEYRQTLLDNTSSFLQQFDPAPMTLAHHDRADAENKVLTDILTCICEQRRRNPTGDLLSDLVQAEEQGDRLTAQELIDNVIQLFAAGFDTTSGLIGNALLALLRHPDQLAVLRAEQSLMPGAVEEFLRYDSSVHIASRVALEETSVVGTAIRKGTVILAVLGSANRDETVYDEPDRFDVRRRDIKPVSFGGGIHYCIGAQLARLETEVAVGSIIARFPRLRLHDREPPVRRPGMTLRALSTLPVMISG
jgi:cytochrome P450